MKYKQAQNGTNCEMETEECLALPGTHYDNQKIFYRDICLAVLKNSTSSLNN